MGKVIRVTYPLEFSIGLLLLIFAISFFLSPQVFDVTWKELLDGTPVYLGMSLVSAAVVVMVLVLWEEFLFPIRIKPTDHGAEFRNHRNKLNTQLLIYCVIPAIFVFVYLTYDVNTVRFFVWAMVCTGAPVVGKLVSGLNNYNDFLRLTNDLIEFRNNQKTGVFQVQQVERITLVRDQRNVLHRILVSTGGKEVEIDIDEMELEAYCSTIDEYMRLHYKHLIQTAGNEAGRNGTF